MAHDIIKHPSTFMWRKEMCKLSLGFSLSILSFMALPTQAYIDFAHGDAFHGDEQAQAMAHGGIWVARDAAALDLSEEKQKERLELFATHALDFMPVEEESLHHALAFHSTLGVFAGTSRRVVFEAFNPIAENGPRLQLTKLSEYNDLMQQFFEGLRLLRCVAMGAEMDDERREALTHIMRGLEEKPFDGLAKAKTLYDTMEAYAREKGLLVAE